MFLKRKMIRMSKSERVGHLIVILLLDSCIVELVTEDLVPSGEPIVLSAISSLAVKVTCDFSLAKIYPDKTGRTVLLIF